MEKEILGSEQESKTKRKTYFGSISAFFLKSGKFIKAIKVLKTVKVIKPLITIATMLISLFVYGWAFGWLFGVGIIVMIFVHEMGHVIAMKRRGFATKAPVFIPMLGAVIFAPSKMTREQEAYIGIGGPVLGTLGAIIAWLIWFIHPNHPEIWLIMSYIGLMINLFNMLPIRPLDGGRVTQAIGGWFKWVGVAMLLALTLMMKDPGLLLIWVLVIMDLDSIPVKRRAFMSIFFYLLMVILILSGFGLQGAEIAYSADIIVGAFYIFLIGGLAFVSRKKAEEVDQKMKSESGSDRPTLPIKDKLKWFAVYTVMLIVLIVSLVYQAESLKPWVDAQEKARIESAQ